MSWLVKKPFTPHRERPDWKRMKVLIVEAQPELGALWKNHLLRQGATVDLATTQQEAINALLREDWDVIVLDLELGRGDPSGGSIAVADFAGYRRPEAKVVFVTSSAFFSDGSIFAHIENAHAFLPSTTTPDDLAAVVEHYARAS